MTRRYIAYKMDYFDIYYLTILLWTGLNILTYMLFICCFYYNAIVSFINITFPK